MQEDILMPTLTVNETLMYAACTRMEGISTLSDREQRVNYLLDLFEMVNLAGTIVGVRGDLLS
jgi:ABC-type multidrug transport system ATPase subunit